MENKDSVKQEEGTVAFNESRQKPTPELSADLLFESWWESQGLDGETVRAKEIDRWVLARMAFDAGRAQ